MNPAVKWARSVVAKEVTWAEQLADMQLRLADDWGLYYRALDVLENDLREAGEPMDSEEFESVFGALKLHRDVLELRGLVYSLF